MKYIILILILLMCLIIIRYTKEQFISYTDMISQFKTDEDIFRTYLNKENKLDQAILDKYKELQELREYLIQKKYKDRIEDLEKVKINYDNTKKKLYKLMYNSYKPNNNNFQEKQMEFKNKLKLFIDNEKQSNKVINEKELVLTNNKNKPISLTNYKNDFYIINLNGNRLKYDCKKYYEASWTPKTDEIGKFLFHIIKIIDLHHFNQFIHIKQNDDIFSYPLYLIIKPDCDNIDNFITIKNNDLSIQPLNKKILQHQIFYKK